jgi:hypothetical protein
MRVGPMVGIGKVQLQVLMLGGGILLWRVVGQG